MTDRIRQLTSELRRLRKAERKKKARRLAIPWRRGRGSRDRDEELRKQRGYTDLSTYVRRDGSEVLKGADWRQRVEELRERSGGRCEHEEATPDNPRVMHRCSMAARDPHHKIRRSLRRDDRLENLLHVCRPHHDDADDRNPKWTKREPRKPLELSDWRV